MIEFCLYWLSENRALIHLFLHVLLPLIVAYLYVLIRTSIEPQLSFAAVFLLLMATMAVDVDHLLATPIYSPGRCSIWFHPLHTFWPMVIYGLMAVWPLVIKLVAVKRATQVKAPVNKTHMIIGILGAGLVIHMILDWIDCLWMNACG
jgi:hypothetical protein